MKVSDHMVPRSGGVKGQYLPTRAERREHAKKLYRKAKRLKSRK